MADVLDFLRDYLKIPAVIASSTRVMEVIDEIERLRADNTELRELLVRSRAWIVDGKRDFNDELADEIDAALNKGGDRD